MRIKKIKTNTFRNLNLIELVDNNNNSWFLAEQVCEKLEFLGFFDELPHLDLDDNDFVIFELSDKYIGSDLYKFSYHGHLSLISEAGLYKLIFQADTQEAKDFQSWIAGDALPSIEETEEDSNSPLLDFFIGFMQGVKENEATNFSHGFDR